MDIATFIERGFAIGYLACGLSILIQPQSWTTFINRLSENKGISSIAFVTVYLGAFMVAGHNIWESSPRVIVTIIAWLALLKGFLYLSFPHLLFNWAKKFMANDSTLRLYSLPVVALGSYILWISF